MAAAQDENGSNHTGVNPDPTSSSEGNEAPHAYTGVSSKAIRLFGPKDDRSVCLRMVGKAKKEPRVVAMVDAITKLGCEIDIDTTVECRRCNVAATGGFIPNVDDQKEGDYKPKVVICEDNLLGPHYVAQTMAHELIHAYDQCRAKINWKSDYHYACTEVRASSLSGECDFGEEFNRGIFGWKGQHPKCVRRRAELSLEVMGTPKQKAQEVVNKVFDRCYADTAPFGRIP